jgi:hypothetical protein
MNLRCFWRPALLLAWAITLSGCGRSDAPAPKPVQLQLSGTAGLPFAGSCQVDGLAHPLSGVVPTNFSFFATDSVSYELRKATGRAARRVPGETMQVLLVVDGNRKTSHGSGPLGVRGTWRGGSHRESYSGNGF